MLASSAFFRYPRNLNPISARRIKLWRNTCASQRLLFSLGRASLWTSLSFENSRCSSYWWTVSSSHCTIRQVLETWKYAVFRRIGADWEPWQGYAQGSAVHRCRGADHWRQLLFWRGKGLLLHAPAAWSIRERWLLPDIFQGPVSVPVALRNTLAREIQTKIFSSKNHTVDEKTKELVRKFYAPFVEELTEKYTQQNYAHWKW